MEIKRRSNESAFEWKLRLIKMKLINKFDIEWQEIADLLQLECSADHFTQNSLWYFRI